MTSLLQRLRRGLVTVTLLSLVLALCPCLVSAAPVEDDCCESSGTTMSGACCESDGGRTTAPAAKVLLAVSDFVVAHPVGFDLSRPASLRVPLIPARPVVARAVLRI